MRDDLMAYLDEQGMLLRDEKGERQEGVCHGFQNFIDCHIHTTICPSFPDNSMSFISGLIPQDEQGMLLRDETGERQDVVYARVDDGDGSTSMYLPYLV